jgi:hypothetical protein
MDSDNEMDDDDVRSDGNPDDSDDDRNENLDNKIIEYSCEFFASNDMVNEIKKAVTRKVIHPKTGKECIDSDCFLRLRVSGIEIANGKIRARLEAYQLASASELNQLPAIDPRANRLRNTKMTSYPRGMRSEEEMAQLKADILSRISPALSSAAQQQHAPSPPPQQQQRSVATDIEQVILQAASAKRTLDEQQSDENTNVKRKPPPLQDDANSNAAVPPTSSDTASRQTRLSRQSRQSRQSRHSRQSQARPQQQAELLEQQTSLQQQPFITSDASTSIDLPATDQSTTSTTVDAEAVPEQQDTVAPPIVTGLIGENKSRASRQSRISPPLSQASAVQQTDVVVDASTHVPTVLQPQADSQSRKSRQSKESRQSLLEMKDTVRLLLHKIDELSRQEESVTSSP